MSRLALLSSLFLPASLLAQQGNRDGHANMDPPVPEHLVPPSPLLTPQQALKTFALAPGFLIEPVAAEPLVELPVALDTDPAGRLWVCEMLGYMPDADGTGENIPQGRIVVLEDTDGDGTLDRRTVFLEKIHLPRAVAVFADGVLYTDDEALRFIRRDGLTPVGSPEVAIEGFVDAGNVEHKSNGLMHGLDNWLYNAKSGKRVRRIDGRWVMEDTPFRGQWGIAKDDYGRLYHNHNSNFLFGDYVAPNLLQGNPGVNLKTREYQQIGPNTTWPARVTPGVNRAYIMRKNGYREDTLDPRTYKLTHCTAAAGLTIYRGTNFPEEWYGRALITESSVHLVKAVQIEEGNGKFTGSHPLGKSEWLTSTDERFRPVNLYNAPDGSVLLLDMHHGIIQHRTFMTSYLRDQYISRQLDQHTRGVGRIYRVRHRQGRLLPPMDLSSLPGEELVKWLAHANGWHRDTAQRVLVDRNDASVVPLLERLAGIHTHPLAQIHALWTLEGMGTLTAAPIAAALQTDHPKVLCSALWAATRLAPSELAKLEPVLLRFSPKTDEQKIYLARILGPLGTPAAFQRLARLLESDLATPFVKAAAFSGLDHHEPDFKAAAGDTLRDPEFLDWLEQGAKQAAKPTDPALRLSGETLASYQRGKDLYNGEAACFGCHGAAGEGVPNLGPPLDGSQWVTGKPDVLARVLLHGLTGPVTVAGKTYTTTADMPGLSQNPTITDAHLADIMTFIRNQWSNRASAVGADVVEQIRAATSDRAGRPYTAQELGME